jgi:LysM repeat protein
MSERNSRDSFRDKKGVASDQGSDEDYYTEDVYSPWKKGNVESFMSNLSKSSGLLLVIIGAGVFILVALFVFLPMLRSPSDTSTRPNTEMDAKLKKMEAKMIEMEQNYQKVAQLALQEDQLSGRIDKLTQRLDLMAREIEMTHRQPAQAKTESPTKQPIAQDKPESPTKQPITQDKPEPAAKQPSAPKIESGSPATVGIPEKKVSTEKYHEVKPKETLFGIGRTYSVTVDDLRRLNNMGPTDVVRYGQKLKISK